jgi:phage terminase large subunit
LSASTVDQVQPYLTEAEEASIAQAQFIRKFAFLFEPHAYKICWGGRNGLKSWSIARALLILGTKTKLRILCAREIQKTIKDSVHQLLKDQIITLGLSDFYNPKIAEITGRNGTQFLFTGLSDLTVTSVKSFEGVDILWLEEAETISKNSYDVIIPTIRKEGSEVWISFNPELSTSETYVRFIKTPPEDCVSVFTTYRDNLWRSEKSEKDRLQMQRTDPEGYDNVYEGNLRSTVAGAIYTREINLAIKEKRICRVPYDPALKVHTVWDFGFNDFMSIGLFQKGRAEFRMIGYLEDSGFKIEHYVAELKELRLNWGWDWLPHDGFIQDFKAPSAYSIMTRLGRRVKPKVGTKLPVPNIEVEKGIIAVRTVFHRLIIDEVTCAAFIEHIKRYKRALNNTTQEFGAPVHDQHSHGADMIRYFALVHDKMTNDEELHARPKLQIQQPFDPGTGLL